MTFCFVAANSTVSERTNCWYVCPERDDKSPLSGCIACRIGSHAGRAARMRSRHRDAYSQMLQGHVPHSPKVGCLSSWVSADGELSKAGQPEPDRLPREPR